MAGELMKLLRAFYKSDVILDSAEGIMIRVPGFRICVYIAFSRVESTAFK